MSVAPPRPDGRFAFASNFQHDLMPKIMIRCPIVGHNVSTGLTTEANIV
jgi:hypothetical protein